MWWGVVGVFGPGRNGDDVAGLDGQQLAGHAQRALALDDDEHLLLGVVVVVGAALLAGRDDVEAGAELPGRGALGHGGALAVVARRAHEALARGVVEIADQRLTQFGGCGHAGSPGTMRVE